MNRQMRITVDLDEALYDFVTDRLGEARLHEAVGPYVRDLIQRDSELELEHFEAVKEELQRAFAAPEDSFITLTAEDVIARHKLRRAG